MLSLAFCLGLPLLGHAESLPSDTTDDEQWALYAPVGVANVKITALNQQLRTAGSPTFTSLVPSVGVGLARRVGAGVVLGGEAHLYPWGTGRSGTNRAVTLRGSYALATMGYRIRPLSGLPGLSIFPHVGAGGGALRVQLSPSARSVSELLQSPTSGVTLQRWSFLAVAATTIEYHLFRDTPAQIRIGLNTGYVAAPTSTSWRVNGTRLSGGPAATLEGPFLRLVIGRSW